MCDVNGNGNVAIGSSLKFRHFSRVFFFISRHSNLILLCRTSEVLDFMETNCQNKTNQVLHLLKYQNKSSTSLVHKLKWCEICGMEWNYRDSSNFKMS